MSKGDNTLAGILYAAMLVTALPLPGNVANSATHEADPAAERGASLLVPFKRDLKQALVDGLAAGPAAAIAACRIEAPAIAARLSTDGLRVGRTSHRLRNPDNRSPDWVTPVLEDYLAGDREPRAVRIAGDRIGYVEPIVLQPMCATCHGTAIAPDVADAIAARYPDDEATGFEPGDLRGVFWVTFPAEGR